MMAMVCPSSLLTPHINLRTTAISLEFSPLEASRTAPVEAVLTSRLVMAADFRGYAEIVFENPGDNVQSWHIDRHNFFVVGMDGGQWSPASRSSYNLRDTISRCTVQVLTLYERKEDETRSLAPVIIRSSCVLT